MARGYRMLKGYAEASFIERKSKFIAYVQAVYSEEEALGFLNGIRKKHYDATHNCYAYILGDTMNIQRSSDDGEPSGTAGIPILEVLRKEQLTNSIVVVTRYFGGILLGAGGLIRAYTEGAVNGIRTAGCVRVNSFSIHRLKLDYSFLSKLQYEIAKKEYIIDEVEYQEDVTMKVLTDEAQSENFAVEVAQWTNGAVSVEALGEQLLKVDEASGLIMK